jgi:hypothetical protein
VHGTPCNYNGDCAYVNDFSVMAEGLGVIVLRALLQMAICILGRGIFLWLASGVANSSC